MCDACIVMDLDDTLYKEREYVKSAFLHIAHYLVDGGYLLKHIVAQDVFKEMWQAFCDGRNAFDHIEHICGLDIPVEKLVDIYRTHKPEIELPNSSINFLEELIRRGIKTGLVSDGRSVSQRNKIAALGLERYILYDDIVISEEFGTEKPSEANYRYFSNRYSHISRFIYIGDNPTKDFIAPNRLGWTTIGILDNGENIHEQKYSLSKEEEPKIWIKSINEALEYF